MRMQLAVDQAIQKVCPIEGISFGRLNDKKTWEIQFGKDATDEQKKLAQEVIDKFVWDDAKEEEIRKQLRDDEYKDDLSCKYCFYMYQERNPTATFREFMDYLERL